MGIDLNRTIINIIKLMFGLRKKLATLTWLEKIRLHLYSLLTK